MRDKQHKESGLVNAIVGLLVVAVADGLALLAGLAWLQSRREDQGYWVVAFGIAAAALGLFLYGWLAELGASVGARNRERKAKEGRGGSDGVP